MSEKTVGIKEIADTAFVAVRTMTEPFRSAWLWYGYHDRGVLGRYIRDKYSYLDHYFKHREHQKVQFPELSATPELLNDIDRCFKGKSSEPQCFIGHERSEKWQQMRAMLEKQIASFDVEAKMADYLVSDVKEHMLFFTQQGVMSEVRVDREDQYFGIDGVISQLKNPKRSLSIKRGNNTPGWLLNDVGESNIDIESTIASLVNLEQRADTEMRRISCITNDFYYKRHMVLEREGMFFTGLRHIGIHTIGEMQNASRVLFDQGWCIHPDTLELQIDEQLLKTWIRIRNLPFECQNCLDDAQNETARIEAEAYIQEQAYYRFIMEKLKGSGLVQSFVQSSLYRKYAMEFKDRHAASFGATEMKTAQSMLAGIYLYLFEGISNPDDSPSQTYLAHIPEYHDALIQYLRNYQGEKPPLPEKWSGDLLQERKKVLTRLLSTFSPEDRVATGFTDFRIRDEVRDAVLKETLHAIGHAKKQVARNSVHRKVIETFHNLGLIVSEGAQSRVGMGEVFVSNLTLRTVDIHKEKRFVFPWLKQAGGYLGADSERDLPDIPEAENMGIDAVIQDIFSGETDETEHPYVAQEARIFAHSGTILKYLCENEQVPVSVRKFIQNLTSQESIVHILETMGDISNNDPNIVNRFFPDGLEKFHRASMYRYVFDFVRGCESNIVLQQGSKSGGIHALTAWADMWIGNWRSRDFSTIGDGEIEEALHETLLDAHSRLLELNHAVDDIDKMEAALNLTQDEKEKILEEPYRMTWKTMQETLEVVFGWDTTSMKFLRWKEFWNVWHTLGATWDCICFARKTVFNPKSLKTTY